MKQFWFIFLICLAFLFTGCQLLDTVAGQFVQPKPQPQPQPVPTLTGDQYAAWYNANIAKNPMVTDPNEMPAPKAIAPIPPAIDPVAEVPLVLEKTKLANIAEGAATVAPIPFLREGVEGAVLLASLWTMFRSGQKKTKIVKAMVESIDKEGSPELKALVEKKVVRAGVAEPLHKVVKIVKAASKLLSA